ncbi:putative ABC transporter substrate-binding protein [Aeromonas salmonicida subsp. masoucida NBRC 13784]|nr:putative ABC transporter substrate-binding protein [Aeromonas salmonicida subsp. masoucida NBRC 13784]
MPGRDQTFFEHIDQRKLIGVTGYHYGFADFNANADALKQRFRITLVKDSATAIQGLFKERGEVAILNLAYLNQFSQQYPELATQLLRSDKWDQQYELRALLSPTADISTRQLETWLAELKKSGTLARLWTKYGVQHQAAP